MSNEHEAFVDSLRGLMRAVAAVSDSVSAEDYRHCMAGAIDLTMQVNRLRVTAEERVTELEARVKWLEGDLAAARIRYGVLYQMLIDAGV
ncbi:MAG TPA: hypothetical protein VK899_08750, partial [Gemmatimonadales bacterium]|nr:hypothetical protein [Gemmatimonadales bacterium]